MQKSKDKKMEYGTDFIVGKSCASWYERNTNGMEIIITK